MMWDRANGGTDLMRINFEQIGEKVVAAGLLAADQLRAGLQTLEDPDFVAPSPIMWTALGRKPSTLRID